MFSLSVTEPVVMQRTHSRSIQKIEKKLQKPPFSLENIGSYEELRQFRYVQVPCKWTDLRPPGLLAGGAGAPYKRFHRR